MRLLLKSSLATQYPVTDGSGDDVVKSKLLVSSANFYIRLVKMSNGMSQFAIKRAVSYQAPASQCSAS